MSFRAPWRAGGRSRLMIARAVLVLLFMLGLGWIARLGPAPVAGSPANNAVAQASGTPEALVTLTVEIAGNGAVEVSPEPESSEGEPGAMAYEYPVGTVVTLTATPFGGNVFGRWKIDGEGDLQYGMGWASPLTITLDAAHTVEAAFFGIPVFSDVPGNHPAYEAITELASRTFARGYSPDGCAALNRDFLCYAPEQFTVRAESAVFLTRLLNLQGEDHGHGGFSDIAEHSLEVQQAIGTLKFYGIFQGYGDGRFGPNDWISHTEMALVISRALVLEGYWTRATVDDASVYPNLDLIPEARLDLVTFVQNAGELPGFANTTPRAAVDQPAQRAWTARALWQALDMYFGWDVEGKGGYVP